MNRALFSGVSGLKAHQTKMDVIGNNIANVNTYGYKSQRVVFSDVFYQTVSSATEGTTSKGGTNPSSIGYGSQLASIQTDMSQSSLQSTSYGLDVAITGEGFFQVMDGDGNIFYTKAGVLDYDANGYLTDVNGNFVLGASDSDSDPDSKKIKLDDIGSVPASQATAEVTANDIKYTLKAANETKNGNISVSLGSSSLAAGLKAKATISTTGAVNVLLNSTATFSSITDIQNAINAAIKEANGGKELAAGNLTLTAPDAAAKFTAAGGTLTGAEICGSDYSVDEGTITGDDMYDGAITLLGTSSGFTGNGTVTNSKAVITGTPLYSIDITGTSGVLSGSGTVTASNFTATYNDTLKSFLISMTVGGNTYTGTVEDNGATSLVLKNNDDDYINLTTPSTVYTDLFTAADTADGNSNGAVVDGTSIPLLSSDLNITAPVNNFTAKYQDTDPKAFVVSMKIGDRTYQGTIDENETASSLLLKYYNGSDYDDDDYMEISIPSYSTLFNAADTDSSSSIDTTSGEGTVLLLDPGDSVTFTPAEQSNDLGLASTTFSLTGGTEGGAVTLDQLSSIAIGSDGVITVTQSDLGTVVAGKISLANFANPSGLQSEGSDYYSATANSGDPVLCDPGSDGTGELQSNTLELSNVDLSSEFADMITTQRGFQANSRIITVSDTMLEELINLKR